MFDDWKAMSGPQRKAFTLELLAVYGWRCVICSLPIEEGTESTQHMIPRSRGGRTTKDNCRPAHRVCNSSLGNRELDLAMVHDGLAFFCDDPGTAVHTRGLLPPGP